MVQELQSEMGRETSRTRERARDPSGPPSTIDAYLEGLADGVVPAEPTTWALLHAETGRLGRLSDDITRLSRAEERMLDLRLERAKT